MDGMDGTGNMDGHEERETISSADGTELAPLYLHLPSGLEEKVACTMSLIHAYESHM